MCLTGSFVAIYMNVVLLQEKFSLLMNLESHSPVEHCLRQYLVKHQPQGQPVLLWTEDPSRAFRRWKAPCLALKRLPEQIRLIPKPSATALLGCSCH